MIYEHTQSEPRLAALVAAGATIVTLLALLTDAPALFLTAAIAAFVAFVGFSLSKLTTIVVADTVTVSFRFGWPKRVIQRSDIASVRPVRTKWWYGWGIRFIPGSTMYNVWGLDAVQLDLVDGRGFRIGTDDPDGLASALAG